LDGCAFPQANVFAKINNLAVIARKNSDIPLSDKARFINELAKFVSNNQTLTKLRLSDFACKGVNFANIIDCLEIHGNITKLDLSQNKLSYENCAAISELLKILDLSRCQLNKTKIRLIIKALEINPSLQTIILHRSTISLKILQENNYSIEYVSLSLSIEDWRSSKVKTLTNFCNRNRDLRK
jgi:hypothetical protein